MRHTTTPNAYSQDHRQNAATEVEIPRQNTATGIENHRQNTPAEVDSV